MVVKCLYRSYSIKRVRRNAISTILSLIRSRYTITNKYLLEVLLE